MCGLVESRVIRFTTLSCECRDFPVCAPARLPNAKSFWIARDMHPSPSLSLSDRQFILYVLLHMDAGGGFFTMNLGYFCLRDADLTCPVKH
jgi:hypothetical protein